VRRWSAYGLALSLAIASGCERPAGSPREDTPAVELAPPVAVGAGVGTWIEHVRRVSRPTLRCSPVAEITGAVLCATVDARTMNRVFARMSLFAEGAFGHPAGELPAHDGEAMRRITDQAMGHDLDGADLGDFYRLVEERCPREPAVCLTPAEHAFEVAVMVPASRGTERLVVIAFALQSAPDRPVAWRGNAHHELLHAQYFLDARYRGAVSAFWASLTDGQQDAVRHALASIYATDRDELVENELQAYLLQEDAEQGLLGPLVSELAGPLRERLASAGTGPIRLGSE